MANVFEFLKPKAHLSRNAFDLSQRHIFSAKAGQLLPVMSIDCLPGDYHEIDVVSLVRTMPVRTDAFLRLKGRFIFAFVPYQQLWSTWNQFITQTLEPVDSLHAGTPLPSFVPYFNLAQLLSNLVSIRFVERRNLRSGDLMGFSSAHNAVRLLDMLGYGSFYNYIERVDAGGTSQADEDAILQDIDDEYLSSSPVRLNPFRILAYQKIYNDFFRSTQYETPEPELFNVDRISWNSPSSPDCTSYVTDALCNMRYSLWKKDMFTALFPTPQFGNVSSVDLGEFQLKSNNSSSSLSNVLSLGRNDSDKIVGVRDSVGGTYKSLLFSSSASIDVYQLRKAEMFQKWKEDKLRAGNKVKNQAIAMFGDQFRYDEDKYADFIKEVDFNLSIDEVVNSAQSDAAPLGEIGGKGIGTGSGHVTYKCKDFGVLMCIFNATPSAEYDALGIDKNNTLLEPFDFYTPHFEDLGLESVSAYQLNANVPVIQVTATGSTSAIYSKVLGYAPRFLNYKTAQDKVHGQFMSTGHWNSDSEFAENAGQFASWNTPRTDLEYVFSSPDTLPIEMLHVNPKVLDPIFYALAGDSDESDHFLINTNFVINSVRNLSVLGLPRW